MKSKLDRAFSALANSDVLLVEPGFPVEERTLLGMHGDDSDSAITLRWRDAAGCVWEADFTEGAIKKASVKGNRISLKDSDGSRMTFQVLRLAPAKV